MTLRVRASHVDGPVLSTALGSIAVRTGDVVLDGTAETAVLVISGEAEWAGGPDRANDAERVGGPLGVGDGVHGPCRLTGDALLLVLTSRHPAPEKASAWRYAPAGRPVGPPGTELRTLPPRTTADALLDGEGGFTDMGVRWLATSESLGTKGVVVATSTFTPGGHHDLHRHPRADEFFLVLHGGGHHLAPDGPVRLDPGDLVHVPAGVAHGFRTDPGTVTTALYGYLGAGSLDQAGYEVGGGAP